MFRREDVTTNTLSLEQMVELWENIIDNIPQELLDKIEKCNLEQALEKAQATDKDSAYYKLMCQTIKEARAKDLDWSKTSDNYKNAKASLDKNSTSKYQNDNRYAFGSVLLCGHATENRDYCFAVPMATICKDADKVQRFSDYPRVKHDHKDRFATPIEKIDFDMYIRIKSLCARNPYLYINNIELQQELEIYISKAMVEFNSHYKKESNNNEVFYKNQEKPLGNSSRSGRSN